MKIIYDPRYAEVYVSDPAAKSGRMEAVLKKLQGSYDFLKPEPANEEDLERVHTRNYIDSIKRNPSLYEIACLSAGGAILATELAIKGTPTFGLIRPPGHHASPDHGWGFCFFNNIAIALAKLKQSGQINQAFILDFDLHFGDGTANFFSGSQTKYFHPEGGSRQDFVASIREKFEEEKEYDVLAISAGFDRGIEDWGKLLTFEDYKTIGQIAKEAAENICQGRRFALLEGGYNHQVLGNNVKAFLEGFE